VNDYPYPKDEFDEPPAPGQPVGVHLPRRGTWDRLRAFVIVLVIAAVLAYGIVWWFSTQTADKDDAAAPTTTSAAPVDPTDAATTDEGAEEPTDEGTTPEDSEEPTDEPTDEETTEEADELDRSVAIRVLNSTNVSGLAATAADALVDDGWSGAEAANFTGTPPSVTSVWYQSEEYADEAAAIAESLGVEQTTLVDSLVGPISVILRPDYTG
jgi:cytoskeletal protein RodZ